MKPRKLFFLTVIAALAGCALADDLSTRSSFAERFPIESIVTADRAREVDAAFKIEKAELNARKEAELKRCYRDFFVTMCQDRVKSEYFKKYYEARNVWVAARDFLRQQKTDKAVTSRLAREAEEAQKIQVIEAKAPRNAPTPQTASELAAEVERKAQTGNPHSLTRAQEKANEAQYAKKQSENADKSKKEAQSAPDAQRQTEAERVAALQKRRIESQRKQAENLRKRKQQAEDYERQVRMRKELEGKSVTDDLIPSIK